MKYIEMQILTTTEASEAVSNILYEEGADGVVIEDPNDFAMLNRDEKSWDYVEPELVAALGTDVKVKGYFSELEYTIEKLSNIQKRINELDSFGLNKGKAAISTKTVQEEDWANAWKDYYKPTKVGEKVVIKPTWEEYLQKEDEIVVELDPGMAFGTGTHETTVMCIKLLEEYVKNQSIVFDIGCGSGILGITAAKLGAAEVICGDFDEVACKVSRENAELNNVSDIVKVRHGDLLQVVEGKADIIVANIIADIIIRLTDDVGRFLADEGIFISSGIIKDRRDDVINKLKTSGYEILKILEMGEWCAIAAKRE